jgi:hypothetical protein
MFLFFVFYWQSWPPLYTLCPNALHNIPTWKRYHVSTVHHLIFRKEMAIIKKPEELKPIANGKCFSFYVLLAIMAPLYTLRPNA